MFHRVGFVFLILIVLFPAMPAAAQSTDAHHLWQDARMFYATSRTAESITGNIVLSGNAFFGQPGSQMSITFGTGETARLVSEGASQQDWDFVRDYPETAEVFRFLDQPGRLVNGNVLCGRTDGANLYAVFVDKPAQLRLMIFVGDTPPQDVNGGGHCGSYYYST